MHHTLRNKIMTIAGPIKTATGRTDCQDSFLRNSKVKGLR